MCTHSSNCIICSLETSYCNSLWWHYNNKLLLQYSAVVGWDLGVRNIRVLMFVSPPSTLSSAAPLSGPPIATINQPTTERTNAPATDAARLSSANLAFPSLCFSPTCRPDRPTTTPTPTPTTTAVARQATWPPACRTPSGRWASRCSRRPPRPPRRPPPRRSRTRCPTPSRPRSAAEEGSERRGGGGGQGREKEQQDYTQQQHTATLRFLLR